MSQHQPDDLSDNQWRILIQLFQAPGGRLPEVEFDDKYEFQPLSELLRGGLIKRVIFEYTPDGTEHGPRHYFMLRTAARKRFEGMHDPVSEAAEG